MTLFCIPGFLGQRKDWGNIGATFPPDDLKSSDLGSWAKQFNSYAESFPTPRILCGYSLGGRKSLHALIDNPSLWSKAVLLSTHPGLQSDAERALRTKSDRVWADRFLSDPWDLVLKDWESQEVFKGSLRMHRPESNFERSALAEELKHYSLGLQMDLRCKIQQLQIPVFWIAGTSDAKFSSLALEMESLHSYSKAILLQGEGHRFKISLIFDLLQI
jgi:2-succinyl-6-hydroxy-2,4-cyclohexadiene-1-carboxylate synthase